MKESRSGMQGLYERDAGSGVWWIRWSVAGKIHRQQIGDYAEAIAALAIKRLQAKRGEEVKLRERKVRFGEIVDSFLVKENCEAAGKAATTVAAVKFYTERYIKPHFAEYFAAEIDPAMVQDWLRALQVEKKLSGPTIRKIKNLHGAIFKYAVLRRMLPLGHPNPCGEFRLKRMKSAYRPIKITPVQVERICKNLSDPRHRALVSLCAITGLRASEALGLKWADINWLAKEISVERSWAAGKIGKTKTIESEGEVPMSSVLVERLKEYRQQSKYKEPEDWVFPSLVAKGKIPMTAGIFVTDYLRPAALKAGVQIPTGHRFGLHNFRSGLATYLVSEGLDPKTVQGLLRHANVEMTLSAYAQTIPEKVRAAQQRFSEAMETRAESTAETIPSGTLTDTQMDETDQFFQ